MTHEQKANERIEKYLNTPIDFPYIDTEDGQCIVSGYMTYKSAVRCAIDEAEEMILQFKESDSLFATNFLANYWQEVKTELNKRL